MNLDTKDKKILHMLMDDARVSIADIARDVGMQRDTVRYRIEKFEKAGLIKKYHTIIDPIVLGAGMFMMVMIKVRPVASIVMNGFVKELVKIANVTHITQIHGNYDYVLTIAAESIKESDEVLDRVKSIQEGLLLSVDVFNIIDEPKTDDFKGIVEDMRTWGA